MNKSITLLAFLLLPFLLISQTNDSEKNALPLFEKINSGALVQKNTDSRSVNFVDVNNDGWDDIFISNGPSNGENNMLYINNQDGTFTKVTGNPIY